MGDAEAADLLQPTELEHLKIIPSSKHLIGANVELVNAEFREYRLRHALHTIRDQFEVIVLDCPPALDLLTLNALVAADSVLVPMQAEYFALEGVSELLDTIERIRQTLIPASSSKASSSPCSTTEPTSPRESPANSRPSSANSSTRRRSRAMSGSPRPQPRKPALLYDPRSRGAEAYTRLAVEVLNRIRNRATTSQEVSNTESSSTQPTAPPSEVQQ